MLPYTNQYKPVNQKKADSIFEQLEKLKKRQKTFSGNFLRYTRQNLKLTGKLSKNVF